MSERLGELLVRENLISLAQLRSAQDQQRKSGERLGAALVKLGAVGERDLTNFLSRQYGVPSINLDEFEIDDDIIKLIPRELAHRHQVLPISRAASSLIVAMADPSNLTPSTTSSSSPATTSRWWSPPRGPSVRHRALLRQVGQVR
jgi:type IV pilus assembly protein PilB